MRILVYTNFFKAAAKALPYATSLALEYKAELHVIHVNGSRAYRLIHCRPYEGGSRKAL